MTIGRFHLAATHRSAIRIPITKPITIITRQWINFLINFSSNLALIRGLHSERTITVKKNPC